MNLKKEFRRNKAFYCLMAAHCYEMAHIHGACAKPTSLKDAEEISGIINLFIDDPSKETKPYQFMKSPEEEANKAISDYKYYQRAIELMPSKKRLINGFSKWYANCGWDSAMIKCNYFYIEAIASMSILLENRKIDEKEYYEFLDSLSKSKNRWFSFDPKSVKWSFAKVLSKCDEIEKKIRQRTNLDAISF